MDFHKSEINEMLTLLRESTALFEPNRYSDSTEGLINNLGIVMNTVAQLVYDKEILCDICSDAVNSLCTDRNSLALNEWIVATETDISRLEQINNTVDYEFERMILTVKRSGEDKLCERLIERINRMQDEDRDNYERMAYLYHSLRHLWGEFNPFRKDYEHFERAVSAIVHNAERIRWLYDCLEDYRSKTILYRVLRFWLTRDLSLVDGMRDEIFDDYFDIDILGRFFDKDEVFVDCGACDGDTAELFIRNCPNYKSIYLYEMVPVNIEIARKKLNEYQGIFFKNVGVSSLENDKDTIVVRNVQGGDFSLKAVTNSEDSASVPGQSAEVGLTTIDKDIKEKITFIKMDIEGAELDAISGAVNHIKNDKPVLTISLYHNYQHMWEIPELIHSIREDYRFYIRYYGVNRGLMTMDYVLYAV